MGPIPRFHCAHPTANPPPQYPAITHGKPAAPSLVSDGTASTCSACQQIASNDPSRSKHDLRRAMAGVPCKILPGHGELSIPIKNGPVGLYNRWGWDPFPNFTVRIDLRAEMRKPHGGTGKRAQERFRAGHGRSALR
jgi:hypothetical protein